jgi:hypothetical protein
MIEVQTRTTKKVTLTRLQVIEAVREYIMRHSSVIPPNHATINILAPKADASTATEIQWEEGT